MLSLFARDKRRRVAWAGFACLVGAVLIIPCIWSGLTTLYSTGSSPEAYTGQGMVRRGFGSRNGALGEQIDDELLTYLQAHTQGMEYLMAVPSLRRGRRVCDGTGRPVLYMGGFDGQDKVETPDGLATLVADHELRYIYEGSGLRGPGGLAGSSEVATWISTTCKVIQFDGASTQGSAGADANSSATGFFGSARAGRSCALSCQATG